MNPLTFRTQTFPMCKPLTAEERDKVLNLMSFAERMLFKARGDIKLRDAKVEGYPDIVVYLVRHPHSRIAEFTYEQGDRMELRLSDIKMRGASP